MFIKIFFAVVVVEFFTGLDATASEDEDVSPTDLGLAVRSAGVVDVACYV